MKRTKINRGRGRGRRAEGGTVEEEREKGHEREDDQECRGGTIGSRREQR